MERPSVPPSTPIIMIQTRQRPKTTNQANGEKSTESSDNYAHASRGFAHWLEVAPPTTSFTEVVEAHQQYESPYDVWGSGPNRKITEFGDNK